MAEKLLTPEEAARKLGLDDWGLVDYVANQKKRFTLVDGRPCFSMDDLITKVKSKGDPNHIEKELLRMELTGEQYIMEYIRLGRKDEASGVHSRPMNNSFRKRYPDNNPVELTKRMERDGTLMSHPYPGGFIVYERTSEVEEKLSKRIRKIPTPKGSYDSPNKNKWREEWMSFIERNLEITPQTRVLFLAGPEALEVEGYDRLGIRRESMVCVERHRETAEIIEGLKLGIKVENAEMLDYLGDTEDPFDIVLFDYDGKINQDTVDCLERLILRGLLKEKSVLGMNLFGKRESDSEKMLYLEPFRKLGLNSFKQAEIPCADEVPERVWDWKRDFNGLRNYGLTALMMRMLRGNDAVQVSLSLMNKLPRDKRREFQQKLQDKPPKNYMDKLQVNEDMTCQLMKTLREEGPPIDGTPPNREPLSQLAAAYAAYTSRPYFVGELQRRIYFAEKSTNVFYSDFMALDQKRDSFEELELGMLKNFTLWRATAESLYLTYDKLSESEQSELDQQIGEVVGQLRDHYSRLFLSSEKVPRRRWIGNPAKVRLEKAVKQDIAGMIAEGKTNEEILLTYPEAERSLAGIKSAYSKGAYKDVVSGDGGGK